MSTTQVINLSSLLHQFNNLSNLTMEDAKDVLEAGARVIQIHAMNNVRTKLNRHPTGNLVQSIKIRKAKSYIDVGAFNTVYAKIHEFGGIITPRRAKALHFFVDKMEVFAKRVHIPPRPYLKPAVDEHLTDILQVCKATLQRIIDGKLKT